MESIIRDLEDTLEKYHILLRHADEVTFGYKSDSASWSRKEELGHLVDSAQNNIQRFIRVQYEAVHVIYNPDQWVLYNRWQSVPLAELSSLWYLLNRQLLRILRNMDASVYEKPIDIGYEWSDKRTARFIAEDYVAHMKHHLEHIFREHA